MEIIGTDVMQERWGLLNIWTTRVAKRSHKVETLIIEWKLLKEKLKDGKDSRASLIDVLATIYGMSHDSADSKSSEVSFVGLDLVSELRVGSAAQLSSFSAPLC